MTPAIDPALGWPAALVLVAIIIVPQVGTWISTVRGNRKTEQIKDTLTQNNHGGSVKDALDRIETTVRGMDRRVASMEERVTVLEEERG